MLNPKLIATMASLGLIFTLNANANNNKQISYLDNIVVTGTKTEHTLGSVPVQTVLITNQEIEKSNAKTISELLSSVPGFNFSQQNDIAASMGYKNTVRGLNVESRYLLVLVDGQRVFTGYHSGGMSSAGFSHNVNVVPVDMIEKIEVVKGPGSALYGSDAVVGVLNIITKRAGNKFEVNAGITYGSYKAKGANYMGIKAQDISRKTSKMNLSILGPVSDTVKMALYMNTEKNDGTQPSQYDIKKDYIHANTQITPNDNLELSLGAELTKWEQSAKKVGDDNNKEDAKRIYLLSNYNLNENQKFKFNAYHQNLEADFSSVSYGKQDADVSYTGANLEHTLLAFDNHIITSGLEYVKESLDTNIVKDKSIKTTSVYFQDEISAFDDKLVIMPGFRFEDNDIYGNEFIPKLNAMYNIDANTKIKAQIGRAFKAPSGIQTLADSINHIYMWIDSNKDLKPESSITWQVGFEKNMLNNSLLFSTTYYHMDIKDKISQQATSNMRDGLAVYSYTNIDEAVVKGLETSLRYAINDATNINFSHTYTNSKDKKTNKELYDTPKHTFNTSIDYVNKAYGFGGMVNFNYTGKQNNQVYMPSMSAQTKAFKTVGFNIWKNIFTNGKIKLEVSNLFDEDLKGSDTIYVGRSGVVSLEYKF